MYLECSILTLRCSCFGQSLVNHEADQRRASSYHSFSQSPPYEYLYEARCYGKQFGMLARGPDSDRGHYEEKISIFAYSPSCLCKQMYADRFANESSGSRFLDFSLPSTGDPFRYDGQSPNSPDAGYCSPPLRQVREVLVEDAWPQMLNRQSEANVRMNLDGIMRPVVDLSLYPLFILYVLSYYLHVMDEAACSTNDKSLDSDGLSDVLVEPVHSTETHQAVASAFTFSTQSSASLRAPKQDLFNLPFVESPMTSSTLSVDLSADFSNQPSSSTLQQKPSTVSFSENEGWATFDLPHHTESAFDTNVGVCALDFPDDGSSKGTENASTSMQNNSQWFSVQGSVAPAPFTPTTGPWHASPHEDKISSDQKSSQVKNF